MATPTPAFGAAHFDKLASTYETPGDDNPLARVARTLVALSPPITSTSTILDNAAGTGVVTGAILAETASSGNPKLFAADISPNMIGMLRKKNWPVDSAVMDAQALTYADNSFTHVFMNMGIFLVPDPVKAAEEMWRVLQPGGTAVVTSIRSPGWVAIFQDAQRAVRPDEPLFTSPVAPEWSTKEHLVGILEKGGFDAAEVRVEVMKQRMLSTEFEGPLTSNKGMVTDMITKDWAPEERAKFEEVLDGVLEKEKVMPRELTFETWVAIAKKTEL